MSPNDASAPYSLLPQVQAAWNFPLFEAIVGRRSRRFGLGMELSHGPFSYKSDKDPVPLDEAETAMLVAAATAMDVVSGQVDMLFSVLPLVLPYIASGQLRAIAIASDARSTLLPDVPTVKESGFSQVVGTAWNGIVAPAGTPGDIIIKLNGEVTKVLDSAETKERFAVLGMEALGGSAEHFAEFLRAESEKWSKVIKAAQVQVQ